MTGFNSKREAAADKLQEPEQEPVSFPCCGYTDANAIRWNQFNGVVQCHMCGQVYTVAQPAQEPVCDKDPQGCWNVRCQLGKQCKNLAQPAQEPLAHVYLFDDDGRPLIAWDNAKGIKIGDKLYTAPPQGDA